MSDTYKPISGDPLPHSSTTTGSTPGTVYTGADPYASSSSSGEAGKTVLAALLGGVASAVGYVVYTRLPDDQKDRLRSQVRTLVESRVNELRGRFNL